MVKSTFILCVLSLFLSCVTMAQSLSRQTLCSTGGSNVIDGVLVSQTIGQPYHTGASYNYGLTYRPGFQQPAGVYEVKSTDRINFAFFPNPVFNSLTVQSSEVIPDAVVTAVDIRGKTVYTRHVSNLKTFSIDCQLWVNGTYVFSVSNGNSVYSSAIIVNHY